MKTLSITMEEPLVKEVDHSVREYKFSGRSEAIREAVKYWLRKRNLKQKIKKEIEGYRKKPVSSDEMAPFLTEQEWPE